MDRIEPARKHSAGLLANRYLLNDSLFGNDLGTLYQARDTQSGRDSSDAQVLIHIFPSRALGYTTLKTVCERLQQRGRDVGHNLLPIIDCGWAGTDAFFVLEAPQSWSLTSLPVIQNARMSSLHEKAIHITADLIKKDLVREGLYAQLFLVTPDGDLHLPGTALSENLQSQQHRQQGLLHPGLLKPEAKPLPWQAIGFALAGVAMAGGAGVYYQSADAPQNLPTRPATLPLTPAQPAAMNTTTVQPKEIVHPSAQVEPSTVLPITVTSPPTTPVEPITLSKLDTPDTPPIQTKEELEQQAAQALSSPEEELRLTLDPLSTDPMAVTSDLSAESALEPAAELATEPEPTSEPTPEPVVKPEPIPEPEPVAVPEVTTKTAAAQEKKPEAETETAAEKKPKSEPAAVEKAAKKTAEKTVESPQRKPKKKPRPPPNRSQNKSQNRNLNPLKLKKLPSPKPTPNPNRQAEPNGALAQSA